jgi:hypothetical protein
MKNRMPGPSARTQPHDPARAVLAYGLWLRVGVTGAGALVVGLLQLFDREAQLLPALALAGGGSVLAAIGWARGRRALGMVRIETAAPEPAGTHAAA